jgi:hypothetical protein
MKALGHSINFHIQGSTNVGPAQMCTTQTEDSPLLHCCSNQKLHNHTEKAYVHITFYIQENMPTDYCLLSDVSGKYRKKERLQ